MVVDVISRSVLPAIADIEADLFETPLSLSALERLVNGPAFTGFASFEIGVLCGYVLAHLTQDQVCLLYTSPSPRDVEESRMPSSA